MFDWLSDFWSTLTWPRILIGVGLFAGSIVLNVVVIALVFVKIPATYFSSHYQNDFLPDSSWIKRWGTVIAKNIAGLVMIVLGIIQLIGPGQGILSILTGLVLLDIPGKRPLEAKIIQRPTVLAAVNKLRARYNKPPLIMD
jgi:hypothetical protein